MTRDEESTTRRLKRLPSQESVLKYDADVMAGPQSKLLEALWSRAHSQLRKGPAYVSCWRPIRVTPVGFKSDSHFRFCVRSWSLVSVRGRSWSGLAMAR
jgi:hypothetical protein